MLKFYFASIISVRSTVYMRKGKDADLDPGPYLWLRDPDPGGPKTCGILRIRVLIPNTAKIQILPKDPIMPSSPNSAYSALRNNIVYFSSCCAGHGAGSHSGRRYSGHGRGQPSDRQVSRCVGYPGSEYPGSTSLVLKWVICTFLLKVVGRVLQFLRIVVDSVAEPEPRSRN